MFDNRKVDFGRPSRRWEYKGEAIGTYMKKELLKQEWTVEVKGKDFYDLLGSETIKDYSFDITIDGVDIDGKTGTTDHNTVLKASADGKANSYFDETYMARTYKSKVGQTGKGVLTQVFVNPDTKHVDVAVINTYLAKATADYSEKKDEVTLKVYALTSNGGSDNNEVFYKYPGACKVTGESGQTKNLKITSDDFDIKDIKKDDIFLVTESNGAIKTLNEPEVLSAATLTAFSKNNYVVTGGTQYDYNTTIEYDCETLDDYTSISTIQTQQLKNLEYNVYLDPYGYAIGVKVVEAAKNYVFLTGIDLATSNLNNKTAKAAGILLDGTFVNFTMDLGDSVAYYNQGGKVKAADMTKGREFTAGPLWNTWCSYTVDKDGVYTLTQVKHEAERTTKDKAGQYHDNEAFAPNVAAAADAKGKTINDKNVSLKAAKNTVEGAAADKYVYGNDKTVYIVPELKSVASDSIVAADNVRMPTDGTNSANVAIAKNDKVGIVSGVDSFAVGITNVDLVTWNADQIDNEIDLDNASYLKGYSGGTYTLYNNDGYIIAAIVVGEDNGTSKTLVYSHKDSLSHEEYSSDNDQWTWQRKVILNGEEATLTEKGSKLAKSGLKTMTENTWYEVKYKADGTVKDVTPAYYSDSGKNIGKSGTVHALDLTLSNNSNDARNFVNNVTWVENAINNSNKSTVLYEEVWGDGTDVGCVADGNSKDATGKGDMTKAPSLVESTLYVDTAASKGFYVHDDVKTVLIQKNDGNGDTIYGTGKPDLEAILGDLNYDATNTTYLFKISAILTNGRASVVIIHDWNETGATTDGNRNPSGNIEWISTDASHNFANPIWWTEDGNAPTLDQIREMLESEGCTGISYDAVNGWSFTTKGGTRVTGQTITAGSSGQRYKVTINGTETWSTGSVDLDSTTVLGEAYNAAKHGDYAKKASNGSYVDMDGSADTITADEKYEVGYYKVTVTAPSQTPTNGGNSFTAAITDNEYIKAGADATVTVKVTTGSATTAGGVQLSVTALASGVTITDGAVIPAGAAGDYTVKLKVDKSKIVTGGVAITLSAADAPATIKVNLDGTEKSATDADTMKTFLTANSVTGQDNVYFLVTAKDGTKKMISSTDNSAHFANEDSVVTTTKYLKLANTGAKMAAGVTITSAAGGETFTPTVAIKASEVTTINSGVGDGKYIAVGDVTLEVTVTASSAESLTAPLTLSVTASGGSGVDLKTPAAGANFFTEEPITAAPGTKRDAVVTVSVSGKTITAVGTEFEINLEE